MYSMIPFGRRSGLNSLFDEFERSFKSADADEMTFKIAVPRVSYLAEAFSRALSGFDGERTLNVEYIETSNEDIINRVLYKSYDLGILRFPIEFETEYKKRLVEMQLRFQEVFTFRFVALMSGKHPLAGKAQLRLAELAPYTNLIHGDNRSLGFSARETESLYFADTSKSRITLYERGGQFDFLRNVPGTYMLVSPMPADVLAANGLVQIPISEKDVGLFVDLIITRKNRRYSEFERSFINCISEVQRQIVPSDY